MYIIIMTTRQPYNHVFLLYMQTVVLEQELIPTMSTAWRDTFF